MKRLLIAILWLLSFAGATCAQDRIFVLNNRNVVDFRTLGGKLGYDPGVNNAQIINAALLDRSIGAIAFPAGIVEITEPIEFPVRSGGGLVGVGCNSDWGDASHTGTAKGGAPTRFVARFSEPDLPMLRYLGRNSTIEGIAFYPYVMPGTWYNFLTGATNATPIVCTTETAHGLSDGDQVVLDGVSGNTAANGTHYVDVTSSTTFRLFSDAGLSSGVAGNGAYDNPAQTALWAPNNRAQIGIHVGTQFNTGQPGYAGKEEIRNCSFHGMQVPILYGTGMDQAWADAASYEGTNPSTAQHADESVIRHCYFYFPYSGTENRTAIYFRSPQSLMFEITKCSLSGIATQFLFFERGGVCKAMVDVNGNVTDGVLKIGESYYPGSYDVWMDIDGGGDADSPGLTTKPVVFGRRSAGAHVTISGQNRAAVNQPTEVVLPQFLIRGSAKVNIENFNGLVPGGIQQLGHSFDTTRRPVMVTLRNCTAYGTDDPADLFTATNGDNASVVPYLRRWDDCQAAFQASGGNTWELAPLTDGVVNSSGTVVPFLPE